MVNTIFNYLWATNDEFKEKYQPIYEDFVESFDDYIEVNVDDIGYALINHWATNEELREDHPDLLDDLFEMHDLSDDQILEVLLQNGGANNQQRPRGATGLGARQSQ